jgi:uroporphyrinogen III methyltransferase/synthase
MSTLMVGPRFAGTRVLVTRPVDQAKAWLRALTEAGAVPIAYPTIEVHPPPTWQPLDQAFAQLDSYDWLIFTSASAVQMAVPRLPSAVNPSALHHPQVAAVGGETARALGQHGFAVARVPDDQRQEGLIAAFGDLPAGTRFLFPQAIGGRDALAAALRARGCEVEVVPASETVPVADMPPLPEFDVATFASPSALEAFVGRHGIGPLAAKGTVVIGPTTAATAHAQGLKPMVARAPRIEDVIRALDDLQRAAGTV